MSLSPQTTVESAILVRAQIRCPACGGASTGASAEVPDYEYGLDHLARYVECGVCGTLFQEPMPSIDQLAAFYPASYHSMTHAGLLTRIRNGLRIRRLARLISEEGPVLDYGCGDGAFLVQAAKSIPGRHLWGFEISDRPGNVVLAGGAVTLVKGDLADLLAVLPKCGLITLNHVIEHLPNPMVVVTALVDRLLPGGIFEGQTPAADSLERRVFGFRWSGYHAPRHTVIFSRAGLCQMLERCGLSAPVTQGAFNPASLAVSLASTFQGGRGHIRRGGPEWLAFLATAAALGPIDLACGRPGIMDFVARKT